MNHWLKRLFVILSTVLIASCTQPESPANESARTPASVKKQRGNKKVTVERKGFLIKHSSLKALSFEERAAYYGIFAKAAHRFEQGIGKKKSYSQNQSWDNILKFLTFPTAEAVPCPTSYWVIDNGQNSCNGQNSFFDPRESSQWQQYGPVGGLTADHCKPTSNQSRVYPCPPLGLEIRGQTAMLICSPGGFSSNCQNAFNNDSPSTGISATTKLLDECDSGGLTSVNNITCSDLRTSVERAIKLTESSCTSENRRNSLVNNICSNVQTAVRGVEQRAREAQDPSKEKSLPNHPSCNKLAEGVESLRDRAAKDASPHWNALLDIARNNCDNLKGKDRSDMRNIFGSCSKSLPFGEAADLSRLASGFTTAASSQNSAQYTRNFKRSFGMMPSHFRSLFCGADEAATFVNRVDRDVDSMVRDSEDNMIRHLRFQDRDDTRQAWGYYNESQFNALKGFYEQNNNRLESSLRGQSTTRAGVESLVGESQMNWARAQIKKAVENMNKDGSGNLNRYFEETLLKGASQEQQRVMRAAISQALRGWLIPDADQQRARQSAQWLKDCSQEVLKPKGDEQVVAGNQFKRDGAVNASGCRYKKETDITGYFASTDRPYIIFRRGINGREPACLEQTGPMREVKNTSGGSTIITRRIDAVNPKNPDDGEDNIALTDRMFDTGASGGSSRQFVLFRYHCDSDITQDESNPFRGSKSYF